MKKNIAVLLIFILTVTLLKADITKAAAKDIIIGKDNWLFYNNPNDGISLPEYLGTVRYTDAKLKSIADNLKKTKLEAEKRGADFVVCIVPNKEIIYPEYMPLKFKRKTVKTRADQLVEYLSKNTDIKVSYPKDDFLEAKNTDMLFYKTDSHYNAKGAFIAGQNLRNVINGTKTHISETKWKISEKNFAGDLAKILGQPNKYSIDNKYSILTKVPKKDKSSKNIIIWGDSFGNRMKGTVDRYFGDVTFTWFWNFSMSQIKKTTDVLVWELTERYIDRLSIDRTKK